MSIKFDSAKVQNLVENILEIKRSGVEAVLIDWILNELDSCRDLSEQADTSIFFEKIWRLYPNKRGKSGVTSRAKKELFKAGYSEVQKAIENYKRMKPDWQHWLDGSTFFNGRWKDWINPESPEPEKHRQNFQARQYSDDFLNSFIGGRDEE